jgi:hypothetical protein
MPALASTVDENVQQARASSDAISAQERADTIAMERASDRAATSTDLRLRVLAADWNIPLAGLPDHARITTPEVRRPTLKELADAAAGSTDSYVLAIMASRCSAAPEADCNTSSFLNRWTQVAPDDARAWLRLALWEKLQGHGAASIAAFQHINEATSLSDPHAEGLRIALDASKHDASSLLPLASLAANAASMETLPQAVELPNWCGREQSLEPACRRLVSLMSERGSLIDLVIAISIQKKLPGTTAIELAALDRANKAYQWVLLRMDKCPLSEAALNATSASACTTEQMIANVASSGEISYANAQLKRLGMRIDEAAAAYDSPDAR